jgi:hypothetical protein
MASDPFVVIDPPYSTKPTYYVHGRDLLGRVEWDGYGLTAHHFLKDHLGTIRTTVKGWESVVTDDFASGSLSQWTVTSGSGFVVESGESSASAAGSEHHLLDMEEPGQRWRHPTLKHKLE